MRIILIAAVLSPLMFCSCDEEQLALSLSNPNSLPNRTADAARDVAESTEIVIQSPAGQLIPPAAKYAILAATNALAILAAGYETWKEKRLRKTTRSIVQGVEATEKLTQTEVKKSIERQMKSNGVYDTGKQIVRGLKNG